MRNTRKLLLICNFIFLYCFGQDYNIEWIKTAGDVATDQALDVEVDALGYVYTVGEFYYDVDFDPGMDTFYLNSSGGNDIFIQKLGPDGSLVWAKSIGGYGGDRAVSLSMDQEGNLYITGHFGPYVDFDPGVGDFMISTSDIRDVFILKLNFDGEFMWVKHIEGLSMENARNIEIDSDGNIYVLGEYNYMTDFDPGVNVYNLSPINNYKDIFILKLDHLGDFVWVKSVGGAGSEYARSMCVDDSGYVNIIGEFSSDIDVDPDSGIYNLSSNGYNDYFILRLDSTGSFVWGKNVGGSNQDFGFSITSDHLGNLYLAGFFKDTVNVELNDGDISLISKGGSDVIIQKINSNGDFIWSKSIGGEGQDMVAKILLDDDQNVYITGSFESIVDFNPGLGVYNLESPGILDSDVFLIKLNSNGEFLNAVSIGGEDSEYPFGISIDQFGKIYICGSFYGNLNYTSSNTQYEFESNGSFDFFVSKLNQYPLDLEEVNSFNTAVIYPNPADKIVNIQMDGWADKKIVFSDIFGRILFEEHINGESEINFDISKFSSGIYFIEIYQNGQSCIKEKLIIE